MDHRDILRAVEEQARETDDPAQLRALIDKLLAEFVRARDEAEWLRDEEGIRNAQLNRARRGQG